MLLYHFPLTSNSATANVVNVGLSNGYTLASNNVYGTNGKLSLYAKYIEPNTNAFVLKVNYKSTYSLCMRIKAINHWYALRLGDYVLGSGVVGSDSNWHDIILCDGKLYVDGVFKQNWYKIDAELQIGGYFTSDNSSGSFRGRIQDIRIYSHILTTQEIADYSKALVLHYPLNGSVKDCSGLGNDLYLQDNRIGFDFATKGVRYYRYADSNTSISRLNYETKTNVYPNTSTTIAFWVKSSVENGGSVVLVRGSNNGAYINGTNNSIYGYIQTTSGNVGYWVANANTNTWKHIVFTFEQQGENVVAKTYLNGVLTQTKTVQATIQTTEQKCEIIRYTNRNDLFSLSDFRVYASALSQADIQALYKTPITLGNSLNAYELKEQPKYKSKAWRTPTYNEMNYILNQRPNASNLRGLGRVQVNGSYINGCFLLPDNFVAPSGISWTATMSNYTTNSYTLEQFKKLESVGVVFLTSYGFRQGSIFNQRNGGQFYLSGGLFAFVEKTFTLTNNVDSNRLYGRAIRLCQSNANGKFATPYGTIDFAIGNLQYHCTQHIWRFAPNQYDYIGQANANISDTYNGWIDLFGYGTSGVNYSPTLHTTNNSDYASGNIANTDNDWGVDQITTEQYEEQNIKLYKSGVIKANEISESTSNKWSKNGILTTELKEI